MARSGTKQELSARDRSQEAKGRPDFDPEHFLAHLVGGSETVVFGKFRPIFRQGDPADAVFYVKSGRVKVSASSKNGREATLNVVGPGHLLGEEAIRTYPAGRTTTAVPLIDSTLIRIDGKRMAGILRENHAFTEFFIDALLARSEIIEVTLIDHLFNSTEKRLARALLNLAQLGTSATETRILPRVSQETLATMIGTTRSRVNILMNRFRKLGYVHYDGEFRVNRSLIMSCSGTDSCYFQERVSRVYHLVNVPSDTDPGS